MENTMIKTPKKTLWLRALCIVIALAILTAIPAVLTPILFPKYLTVSKEGSLTEEYYRFAKEFDSGAIDRCSAYLNDEDGIQSTTWIIQKEC